MMKKLIFILALICPLIAYTSLKAEESATERITLEIEVEKWVEIVVDQPVFKMVTNSSKTVNSLLAGPSVTPSSTFTVTANAAYTLTVQGDQRFVRSTDGEAFWKASSAAGDIVGFAIGLIPNVTDLNPDAVIYNDNATPISMLIDPDQDGQIIKMGIGGVLPGKNTPDGNYALPGTYSGDIIITAVCS